MVKHPVQLGRIATALTLVSHRNIYIGYCDHYFVKEQHMQIDFESEEDLMIWLLEQLDEATAGALTWFKEHKDSYVNTKTDAREAEGSNGGAGRNN
jgi:hypothetical protein